MLVDALGLDTLVPSRDIAARLIREMLAYQRNVLEGFA